MKLDLKDIKWNEVTGLSQIVAIILFVAVFCLGFFLGEMYEYRAFINAINRGSSDTAADLKSRSANETIADVTYACKNGKTFEAVYRKDKVDVFLPDGRHIGLPQVMSASGARYANPDESFVYWNKGNTAFITEGKATTYEDCVEKPLPQ